MPGSESALFKLLGEGVVVSVIRVRIGNLPRFWKRVILIIVDFVALSVALWLSYALRYGVWMPPTTRDQFMVIFAGPLIAIPIFIRMGLYRAVIRYLPERAVWTIVRAMTFAALGWVVLAFVAELVRRGYVPRSVPLFYWMFGVIAVGGSRFLAKAILVPQPERMGGARPIAIYGAGRAGVELANALRQQGGKAVVGFLDDNVSLQRRDVAGLRVYAPEALPGLVERRGVREVILSITKLPARKRREIVEKISQAGLKVRILPPLGEVARGKYLVSQIREIDIDELLGRSSVPPDPELVRGMVEGRTIMVTGAGGSIGSELCRLIARGAPSRLILFEANEFALYQIEREMMRVENMAIVPVLGSITDRTRVRHAMTRFGVEVVFHAAAHKHVPLVEANALEGIRNNVFGTLAVVETALECGVERYVLISSDKAVRPTNVMGATKRWAELIIAAISMEAEKRNTGQRFCAVRFGNVLGSNGSVVPLFKEQIANGGPVTITDPAMTRYFMSIHEAAELIVQAGALSSGGDVFLLEMGKPILIKDLAEQMIRLGGLSVRDANCPDGDIETVFIGKRPGEKMYEELFYEDANAETTRHPKILRSTKFGAPGVEIRAALCQLEAALVNEDEAKARRILFSTIR